MKPKCRAFLLLCLLAGNCRILAQNQTPVAPFQPNIIIINVDDLGYADIGPFGATTPTPNLDRLAKEGRRLTSHYAAPLCSPSRAALMTGSYPKRVLQIPRVLYPASSIGLNPAELTIAELLAGSGYDTACIGKWHLGDQPQFLPTRQGFAYYFGIPFSNDMGPPEDGAKSNPGDPVPQRKKDAKDDGGGRFRDTPAEESETGIQGLSQPPMPLLENERVIEILRSEGQFSLTRRYTERAVDYIRAHQKKPFFLYFSHNAVHFPLHPGKEYLGRSGVSLLADWVMEVDWSVGQVLETLHALDLDSKTLVIFISDNGGSLGNGSNNYPFRGSKATTLEGGVRVPAIVRWPGMIPADTSTDEITTMMDILPTLVRLGHSKLPAACKLDGRDIWPILAGRDDIKRSPGIFYYYRGLVLQAVRAGDWKLQLADNVLFNLREDPGEVRDLATDYPEKVRELHALVSEMANDLGLDGVGPGCRPMGYLPNPKPLVGYDGIPRTGF